MTHSPCPVCETEQVTVFHKLINEPVISNVLWDDSRAALKVPRADIFLAICERCGHIFNSTFDANLVDYSAKYENSLFFSTSFRTYSENLCKRLIERFDLIGKNIVEVGCGSGEWLKLMCALGSNRGWGFDPSYPLDSPEERGVSNPRFFRSEFKPNLVAAHIDFIVSRHTLEHLVNPLSFLASLRLALGENGGMYCEVPNAESMLRSKRYWDLLYEHVSYFTTASLQWAVQANGFEVLNLRAAYSGQYLGLEARTSGAKIGGHPAGKRSIFELAQQFERHYNDSLANELHRLGQFKRRGKRVALWGVGSKGISYLNRCDKAKSIKVVVDVNPRKQGKFVTGSGQLITAPETLKQKKPDIVLIANILYRNEIEEKLMKMGVEADLELI